VALLQAQPGALAEHAVALGYVEKLVRLLAARATPLPAGGLTAELLDSASLLPGVYQDGFRVPCLSQPHHANPSST
jgi:hypothetical protein